MSIWTSLATLLGIIKPVADTVAKVAGATPTGRVATVISDAADEADTLVSATAEDAAAARAGTVAGAAAGHASHIAGKKNTQ